MYSQLILPDLLEMVRNQDAKGLAEFCAVLHPAHVAEILEEVNSKRVWEVLAHCDLARQIEIFEFLDLHKQVELFSALDREPLSRFIEEMSPDDRVDILSRLDSESVESVLPLVAQAERANIRKLLSYPEDSAGAIMTTEYASLPENVMMSVAYEQLRLQAPTRETIYYIYVVDDARCLRGIISLQEMILAKPNALLHDVMHTNIISVRVDDDQEFVAQELARYDFIAIPVIDDDNRLVGIVTHDDVIDILQEEATEDAYRAGAIEPLEDGYLDTPLLTLVWKRGVWLLVLSLFALVTAQVLDFFQNSTKPSNWMILFLPLVLASGGNAGSQSATLVIRSLALGDLDRQKYLQLASRELLVGSMLGAMVAMVGFSAAMVWFQLSMVQSLILLITLLLVMTLGAVNGSMLPLLFKRLGMDPALMSNPLIAALSDIIGVAIYFTIATLLFG